MRANLYEVYWIPHAVQDGLYDADPYSSYESKFLTRQSVPTDVTIDTMVFGAGANWEVNIQVCIEAGGVGKSLKIWVAQVLDHYQIHGEPLVRNAVRAGSAGVEITLAADQCSQLTEAFLLDAPSLAAPENVKFFVWAQEPDFVWAPYSNPPPNGYSWAEVHQADKALAPFPGVFYDTFETGDSSLWSATSP